MKSVAISSSINSLPLFPVEVPAKGPFSKYLQIQFLRGASHKEGARISQYETQIPRNVLSRSQMVHPLVTQSPTSSWQFLSPVVLQFSSNLQSPSLSTFHGLYSNISPCFVTTETKSRFVKIPIYSYISTEFRSCGKTR